MTAKPIKQAGALLALAVFAIFAAGEDTNSMSLKVGSPAPTLHTGRWLQGEPVTDFQNGKVYLIAFWNAYSPAAHPSLRLNQIHQKYKGLIVFGQNVEFQESLSQVEPFIKKMGTMMSYRVALDDPAHTMWRTWMRAADRNLVSYLPYAFLVDTQGFIAWMGQGR